jgi:hypothetical protein
MERVAAQVDCRRAARENERSLTAERQMNGDCVLCCVCAVLRDASGGFGTQRLFGCGRRSARRELAAAPAEYQSSLPSAAAAAAVFPLPFLHLLE